jgi:hypothetical protein
MRDEEQIMVKLPYALSIALLVLGASPAAASCSQLIQEYQFAAPPKAYAAARNGPCGFVSGKTASSLAQAKALAIGNCADAGGIKCSVVQSQAR